MDRIELASQLISKGVELLDESAGRNGYYERKNRAQYEIEKAKNDEYDAKIAKKREQYKRAGYEDKAPEKADRENEKKLKRRADLYHDKRHSPENKHGFGDLDDAMRYAKSSRDELDNNMPDRLSDKQKALHNRINKRTQNETVADLLTEAAYLLSLVDNDSDTESLVEAFGFNKNKSSDSNSDKLINERKGYEQRIELLKNHISDLTSIVEKDKNSNMINLKNKTSNNVK